jgi:hypothetical protein
VKDTPKARKFGLVILAILLWLICFVLGLEDIYAIREISMLIIMGSGGTLRESMNAAPLIVYVLAFLYLIFIIASTEYHSKHFNTPKSWRLFGWTLGVEVVIYIVYRIL